MKATYTFAGEQGHFATTAADGSLILIEASKNFSTSDPKLIAELDAQPSVKRVKAEKED